MSNFKERLLLRASNLEKLSFIFYIIENKLNLLLLFSILSLQDLCIDKQHAVIEYSQEEDCFVLHDLNSAQGTYVNNCRVQNSAVRLAPGDVIRFGYNSRIYELLVDNNSKVIQGCDCYNMYIF